MNNKKSENYLDFIPIKNEKHRWDMNDNNEVTIYVENKGCFNFIAQKIAKKPRVSQIHLEEMGSFIWPLIDGKRSVYDIGACVEKEFGEKANPLYPRLVTYMKSLENSGFITMKK